MATTTDATLGETGEFGLISELVEIFEGDDNVLVEYGDMKLDLALRARVHALPAGLGY